MKKISSVRILYFKTQQGPATKKATLGFLMEIKPAILSYRVLQKTGYFTYLFFLEFCSIS